MIRHAVLMGTALALAACGETSAPPSAMAQTVQRTVRVGVVERGAPSSTSVPAVVQARQRATLSARLAAAVVELPLAEGERVSEGTVVAQLDDRAQRAEIAAAEAALSAARSQLGRVEALVAKQWVTPQDVDGARARVAAAAASLAAARDAVAYTKLRAPFAGFIAALPVKVGDIVAPGQPVVEMESERGLEIVATLDAGQFALVSVGEKLSVAVDGHAAPLEAVVRALSPAGDRLTHRFEMRADLPASRGIRSGIFARVRVPAAVEDTRLLAPSGAFFRRGGLTGVFVLADGRAWLRWVAVGAVEGDRIEVRAGLAEGERIALDHAGLADGVVVVESV